MEVKQTHQPTVQTVLMGNDSPAREVTIKKKVQKKNTFWHTCQQGSTLKEKNLQQSRKFIPFRVDPFSKCASCTNQQPLSQRFLPFDKMVETMGIHSP